MLVTCNDPFEHITMELLEMKRVRLAFMVLGMILMAHRAVAQTQQMKQVYGVGIVGNCCTHGAGLCAQFQGRKETRVVAAFEANPLRARELAAAWGRPLSYSEGAVISNPAVDIVVISCDPFRKAEVVERAAAAGKAILLNKPACDSLDAARRIAATVRRHNTQLVHDIPMIRSEPAFARLQEDVRARTYAKVLGYYHLFGMNFDPSFDLKRIWPERLDPPSRSGGGELANMGCYAIDYAVSLLGRPRSVLAKTRKEWDVYRQANVENFGQIVLDYGDFFAFLEAGKQQLPGPSRHANALTITFEHCAIHIDATAHQVSLNHIPHDWHSFVRGSGATSSADRLIHPLGNGASAGDDVTGIVDATEVLMAAYESSLQAGRPVPSPLARGDNPLTRARTSVGRNGKAN
jgi:predicted dehydrogenase